MPELRNFDLNLLVAFDLLMQEQNVSRAEDCMFVSQSAIHHAETTAATERSVAGQDALRHEANGQGGIGTLTFDANGPALVLPISAMDPISYARHRFPPDVIWHAVWLYLR